MIGHRMSSMVQSARPLTMPHSSFTSRGCSDAGRLWAMTSGECKEQLLQSGRRELRLATQLIERAGASDSSRSEQHEAVAHAFGVGELMNRQHEGAALSCHAAKQRHHFAGLPQIEAVERLVHKQDR